MNKYQLIKTIACVIIVLSPSFVMASQSFCEGYISGIRYNAQKGDENSGYTVYINIIHPTPQQKNKPFKLPKEGNIKIVGIAFKAMNKNYPVIGFYKNIDNLDTLTSLSMIKDKPGCTPGGYIATQ